MQTENAHNKAIEAMSSGSVYKEGLVHNIYVIGGHIVKAPKPDFPDFNNEAHFILEKHSLEALGAQEVKVPSTMEVISVTIDGKEHHCLIENFVQGHQVSWEELTDKNLTNMLDVYSRAHKIKIASCGPLDYKHKGTHKNWGNYIRDSIHSSSQYIVENLSNSLDLQIIAFLENNLHTLSQTETFGDSVFLPVDLNPGNFLLADDGSIESVIDIDHPMAGDKLFDYAPINWHHRHTLDRLKQSHITLNTNELFSVNYYTLLYGLDTIVFRDKHGLPCDEEFEKLAARYSEALEIDSR